MNTAVELRSQGIHIDTIAERMRIDRRHVVDLLDLHDLHEATARREQRREYAGTESIEAAATRVGCAVETMMHLIAVSDIDGYLTSTGSARIVTVSVNRWNRERYNSAAHRRRKARGAT